jgi:hypothetical protein
MRVSKPPIRDRCPASSRADGFVTETGGSDDFFHFTITCVVATTLPLLVMVLTWMQRHAPGVGQRANRPVQQQPFQIDWMY